MSLWATKSIAGLRAEADAAGETTLKRALGPINLVTLGIGAIIGAGIFVLTGQAAALHAGPAVPISMALVGVACAFGFLAFRIAHSTIHCTYNHVMHRFGVYAVASVFLWVMVVRLAGAALKVGVVSGG